MQEKQKKESSAEPGRQEKDSVYDFLYHDAPRIASFLSQFNPSGHLKALTHSDSDSTGSQYGANANVEGSVHATGGIPCFADGDINAKGDLHGSMSFNTGNENTLSRTYDPLWQNSLSLLAYLQQRNLINKNILNSHIGQFVLVSGSLMMLDMGFIQKLLDNKKIKQNALKKIGGNKENQQDSEMGMELFSILPASIQSYFIGEDFSMWSTLKKDGLSLSTDDLHLKHGPLISGEWKMVGILDALPGRDSSKNISNFPFVLQCFDGFFTTTRNQFGRPEDYFGVTPLLIFREVTGNH